MSAQMNGWRFKARSVIRQAIALAQKVDATPEETLKAIDAVYPFGQRRHWPYKIWLEERTKARAELAAAKNPSDPITRRCPACAREAGKPCVAIESRQSMNTFHEARIALSNGPLFAAAEPAKASTCATCGAPATCLGRYEDMRTEEYACDRCCGHGNEDGHCEAIDDAAAP